MEATDNTKSIELTTRFKSPDSTKKLEVEHQGLYLSNRGISFVSIINFGQSSKTEPATARNRISNKKKPNKQNSVAVNCNDEISWGSTETNLDRIAFHFKVR